MHRAFYHVEIVELADAGVDEVKLAGGFQATRNFPYIVKCESGRNKLITTQADAQCKISPDLGADSGNYFHGKTHAIFQRAAIGVTAAVIVGRGELAPQRAMRGMGFSPRPTTLTPNSSAKPVAAHNL